MYQGEHMNNGRTPKARKTATLLVAIVLLLGVAVGTTVAYLIDRTEKIENKFEYAKTDVTVTEDFDGETKSNVKVTNNSNIPVYIRATPVQPNDLTTGSLLNCKVTKQPENPAYTLNVEILATAIQSEPANAIYDAWGVTPPNFN